MNASSQPAADQFSYAPSVAAPRRRSRRAPLAIAGAVVLVLAGFGGGYAVANATAAKPAARTFGAGQGGSAGQGGGASGTVASVSPTQMTITTGAGSSRLVLLTPTTSVTQVTSSASSVSGIASGAQVTIIGTSNPDGSVTATQVVMGNVGGLFGRGARTGAGGSTGGAPVASSNP